MIGDFVKYVVEYLEGGIVQDEAVDDGVVVARFDFDELGEGEPNLHYVEARLGELRSVPESSKAYSLAQRMLGEIRYEIVKNWPEREDLVDLVSAITK
jgi:hypothetical protein